MEELVASGVLGVVVQLQMVQHQVEGEDHHAEDSAGEHTELSAQLHPQRTRSEPNLCRLNNPAIELDDLCAASVSPCKEGNVCEEMTVTKKESTTNMQSKK